MNRVATLFGSSTVVVERFDHPPDHIHQDSDSELTRDVAVTFVEKGSFAFRQDKKWWSFGPSDVLLSVPGIIRRYRHNEEYPRDVCLKISFAHEIVEDAVGNVRSLTREPRAGDSSVARFTRSLMESALGDDDPFQIEMATFQCIVALGLPSPKSRLQKSCGLGYSRAVRKSIEILHHRVALPCSLSLISREVGISPFHFARIFSELVGMPPHHYLLKLRLRHSAGALRQGASVTAAALNSGFNNLSHFARSFRRHFGVLPSQYPRGRR